MSTTIGTSSIGAYLWVLTTCCVLWCLGETSEARAHIYEENNVVSILGDGEVERERETGQTDRHTDGQTEARQAGR